MINERYLVKNKLGEGRSKVFLCEDTENSNETVAIKVLPASTDKIESESFHNEFITLRRLKHPNIVRSFNFGTIVKSDINEKGLTAGSKFFSLEYFDGKPLLEYPDINNEEMLKKIIAQICSVLFYLHQSDYIYYDLKPENILIKKINDEPFIKLIDFGFAEKSSDRHDNSGINNQKYVRGTAEYIAPELLKKEEHDNRIDLYSLGIILYRIIYKKFPFDTDGELKIYKAHLEQDFDFSNSDYSNDLITVIKKLLEKEPPKRYRNSLEVLFDLNIPIDNKIIRDWSPARIFVNRRDVLNILDTYINDKSSTEIFSIKGFEGSGKTVLSEEINFVYDNSVLIKYDRSKSGYQFLKYFLKKIIFNDFIYSNISTGTKGNIESLLQNSSKELIDELKGIFAKVTWESNFILILDDFNSYDNFTLEMIKDIIPIFQVNKTKIIVTEDSDYDYTTNSFHNVKEINLTPFTDVQVSELIEKSYNASFPKEELKKIILLYADLLPGSIEGFIKDCLQLNVIQYKKDKITIDISEETAKLLKSSHDKIYEVRLSYLSKEGLRTAKILSQFELNLDENILKALLESDKNRISEIIEELRNNNILHSSNIGTKLQFTSDGLKRHIYTNFKEKKKYHLSAGNILKREFPDFDRNELARQFELGEDYDSCYEVLKEEIKDAEKISAYSYQKGLFQRLLKLPFVEEQKNEIKYSLCDVLFKISDYKNALEVMNSLDKQNLSKNLADELTIIEGTCLIELGEYKKGQLLLKSILDTIADNTKRDKILLSIAYSNFDLKNYEEAKRICTNIINSKTSTGESKGKSFNLLGMIEIYQSNNINKALEEFNKALENYKKDNLKRYIPGMEVNLGNIYGMQGEHERALFHYDEALKINTSTGNLLQEAHCNLNLGIIHYHNKLNFQEAIEQYNRAYNIFLNLGIKNNQGLVLNNLGESYLALCEYQKSYNSLTNSKQRLREIKNIEEQIEGLFLLGKLFSNIGHKEGLKNSINECSNLEKNFTLSEKYKNYIYYLKEIYFIQYKKVYRLEKLKKIGSTFLKFDDINNFIKLFLQITEFLISIDKIDEALSVLNNNFLIKNCKSRALYEAERLFLLGKLSDKKKLDIGGSSIELILKSFDIIKDDIITELTVKVLLELAEYYSNRGNNKKANAYIVYAKSAISYLSEKFEDVELQKIYLNSEAMKSLLKRIEYLEIQN